MLTYNKSGHSLATGKLLVEYLRDHKQGQHPEIILEVGINIAKNHASILNDITFAAFTEEFLLASLELKQQEWAQMFMKAICHLFPDNIKTMRFLAMFYEAQNNTFKA